MYGFVYSFVLGFAAKNVRTYVAEIIAADAIDADLFKISRGKGLVVKNMPHKEPTMPRPAAISPTTPRPTTVQEKIDTPHNAITGDPLHGSAEAFTRGDFQVLRNIIRHMQKSTTDWPPHFESLKSAKDLLRRVCREDRFVFPSLGGRTASNIVKYICSVVATDAFREGAFTASDHPDGYVDTLRPSPVVQQILADLREEEMLAQGSATSATLDTTTPMPDPNSNAIDEERLRMIDLRAEDLAARFDSVEKLMAQLDLDPADKWAREMGDEIARAEQTLLQIGLQGRDKEMAGGI
jgi:hypothetical protein